MITSQRPKPQSGMTLIEMLIALAVLSLLVVAAVSALRNFAQSQEAIERKIAKVETMRLTLDFLKRNLSQAVAVPRSSGQQSYFFGSESELIWVAPMSHVAASGLQIMRLSADQSGDDKNLVLQISPYATLNSRPDWQVLEKFLMVDGEVKLEVGFKSDGAAKWQEEWPYAMGLPKLVRLNIAHNDVYWPELIIPIHASSKATF